MKRNKKEAKAMRSGTSPYVKYGKREFRYSPAYYAWRRSVAPNASETAGEREVRNA